MKFYTNIARAGNSILVREVVDGISSLRKDAWQPTYYLRDENSTSGLASLYGDKVKEVQPGNMHDARDWCKTYAGVSGIEVFGQQNEVLQYANQYDFHGWDFSRIKVYSVDIEVGSAPDGSFPDPKYALGTIQLITVQDIHTKRCYTWGIKGYVPTGKHNVVTAYTECRDEKALLKLFLAFWSQAYPDIVTGWSVDGFDVPYLLNRITIVLGHEFAKKLSPWGLVDFQLRNYKGRDELEYSITGISVLDMMALMKKFTTKARESWALGSIAQEELGVSKLENPTESFDAFFSDEFHTYVEYNVRDAELVGQLNDKLRLIELALTIAYEAKINYTDVFSPVKTWDAILHNELLARNIVSPQRKHTGEAFGIQGAYVKTPIPGMYKNVVSFDFTSLYPSVMMALNLSPETYIGQCDSTVEKCLSGNIENKDKNVCMGANGSLYRKDIPGIIPIVIKTYMKKRRDAKNAMLDIQRKMEDLKRTSGDKDELHKLNQTRAALSNTEQAYKISLNSLYGALANAGFRYFNSHVAESITLTGQLLLRSLEAKFDNRFTEVMKMDCTGTLFYADTDSVTGDTMVKINGKDITIAEYYAKNRNFYVYEDSFNQSYVKPVTTDITPSINLSTKAIEHNNVLHVMKHRVKKRMFKITVGGVSVTVTEDHSVMILRNNRILSIKPAEITRFDKCINIIY